MSIRWSDAYRTFVRRRWLWYRDSISGKQLHVCDLIRLNYSTDYFACDLALAKTDFISTDTCIFARFMCQNDMNLEPKTKCFCSFIELKMVTGFRACQYKFN